MNVAVLGAGNGGYAVAFDFAAHGHQVNLFDFEQFSSNISPVQANGGIYSEGDLSGFAPIAYAGHDIEQALNGAELIFAVGPAYSTKPFAEACKPYLKPGQIVIVCPSSCGGSFEFAKWAGLKIEDSPVVLAETSTLPYAVRITGPGKMKVFLKLTGGVLMSALPASKSSEVLEKIQGVYPTIQLARNVLQTSLQNGNPVIHPAVSLLNAALIERTGGDFFFYEQGVTPAVGRLMKAIDDERIALGEALGLKILPDPELGCIQGYMTEENYDNGYKTAPGFRGIGAQKQLDNRYFNEDVGYGLVFLKSLADQIGVETPNISALIQIISVLMERDYWREAARTMSSFGLEGYSVEQLQSILG